MNKAALNKFDANGLARKTQRKISENVSKTRTREEAGEA